MAVCYNLRGKSVKSRLFSAVLAVSIVAFASPPSTQVVYTSYQDARPILEAMGEIIPVELRDAAAERRAQAWADWAKKRDMEIRNRLAQGDADSVVNFLMFGTSFTAEPRLTVEQVRSISEQANQD